MCAGARIKVLHMTSELDGGGVDRILYDYCSRMLPEIKADFLVSASEEGILEAPLRKMGCHIFHIPKIRDGIAKRRKCTEEILANNHYDIVHDHSGYKAGLLLASAKHLGVPCRVAHAHIANIPETLIAHAKRLVSTSYTLNNATHLFACGEDAAKWMWSERRFAQEKVHIMPIAVDTAKFRYSQMVRKAVRGELGLDDAFVIGNVARFSAQKNHARLLSIFSSIKKIRPDARLLLVGKGELLESAKFLVQEMSLESSVIFLGVRGDVDRLLNAMDVFVLPSLYEGLPVSLIEVQANGLPLITSEMVTKEALLLPTSLSLPLEASDDEWAQRIVTAPARINNSTDKIMQERDINKCAAEQLKWYSQHA